MVNPLLLIAIPLGWAFLYPLVEKIGTRFAAILSVLVMGILTSIGVSSLVSILVGGEPLMVHTAGFLAPLSINLLLDANAAWLISGVALAALGTLVSQLFRKVRPWSGSQVILFFVLVLGALGLILTRDLFNVFVFMEITGIAIYGLMATSKDKRVFEGGFKYMIAGGLSSVFFLIGIGLLYRAGGALNLDTMGELAKAGAFENWEGLLGLASILAAILIEAKPILASGWAQDAYESADPGIGALMSAVAATAVVAVLAKILPLYSGIGTAFSLALTLLGLISFVLGNFQALSQKSIKRTFGYSSSAQVGLVIAVFGLLSQPLGGMGENLTELMLPIGFVLLLGHALAKSGLFWLADKIGGDGNGTTGSVVPSLRNKPILLILVAVFIAVLLGLPPFPGFTAKWALIMELGQGGNFLPLGLILLGSLLEAAYLMRWFTALCRKPEDQGTTVAAVIPADFQPDESAMDHVNPDAEVVKVEAIPGEGGPWSLVSGVLVACVLTLSGIGLLVLNQVNLWALAPVAALVVFGIFDLFKVPVKVQGIVAMGLLGAFGWFGFGHLTGIPQIFSFIFIGGAVVQMFALLSFKGTKPGLVALITAMVAALGTLVLAKTGLEFFLGWEFMTLTSFFLVTRGRRAGASALSYIVFSLGAAYLILGALALLPTGASLGELGAMLMGATTVSGPILAAGILLALGILIKAGALGFHVWLPSTYAESEDIVSSLMSTVLSKGGLFALFLSAGLFVHPLVGQIFGGALASFDLSQILGWIGVLTAVGGALMALFQEDIKYTLAYSSMSQLGYMILTFALMSHLGWVSSLYLAVTHLLFKGMLFLAVAGVILRVRTRLMYRMGGLIKRMPLTFISVLFGIIALSGVPPLTGFGGKWLMYTSLLEKGWYLQAGLAMFSSGIAFLYLFRLIHSIFLGQLKVEHRQVKEAPLSILIPQFLFMILLFVLSMFPDLLIKPLQEAVSAWFGTTVTWNGYEVISALGYWNGNAVMYVTMGVFLIPLIWLLVVKGRTYWVNQFNIVFSAERPLKPETTHYAFNFFGHYQKAMGSLVSPVAKNMWNGINKGVHHLSDALRRWNTGNPQAYAIQLVLYLVAIIFLLKGGL